MYMQAILTVGLSLTAGGEADYLDLETATQFHNRVSAICRYYGLHGNYGGPLAIAGWPVGLRSLEPSHARSLTWYVTTDQQHEAWDGPPPWVVFQIVLSGRMARDTIAGCTINGKQLYLRLEYVYGRKTVDDPIPAWALNPRGKRSRLTLSNLLERLSDEPFVRAPINGREEDKLKIGLHSLNLFHHRLCSVANDAGLCVYYRGSLGNHPIVARSDLGRQGLRLPDAANPALTWTLTTLDDPLHFEQRVVCQITASLRKQEGSIIAYSGPDSTLHLSVRQIIDNQTVDMPIPDLSQRPPSINVRQLLQRLRDETRQSDD
jgi:hypothetical protein